MFVNVPLSVYLVIVYGLHCVISYSKNNSHVELRRIRRQTSCKQYGFRCDNGQCIQSYSKCDGVHDCSDESDETIAACIGIRCPLKSFQCSYGACIDELLKCNGEANCADGSDELFCRGGTPSCRGYQFKCKSGQCISKYDICDGYKDCTDGSDETRDVCREIQCPTRSFKCVYTGACLDMSLVCNGNKDCIDGSDEAGEDCVDKTVPTISPLSTIPPLPNSPPPPPTTSPPPTSPPLSSSPTLPALPTLPTLPECGSSKIIGKPQPLIIGGDAAPVGAAPWHAGLYFPLQSNGKVTWEQQCGGSLITDQFIITAAHCTNRREEQDIRVALGKYNRSWYAIEDSEQKSTVLKIIRPHEFTTQSFVFDVALLLLDRKVTIGEYVMPVCIGLLNGPNYIIDEILYVVGWGQTENVSSGSSSEILKYNDVKYVDPKDCQKSIPSIFPTFEKFCTVKNTTKNSVAQPGDSGGGLTALDNTRNLHYIVGIVSLKYNQFTVFTNLSWPTHVTWIENEIRKYDATFRWNQA